MATTAARALGPLAASLGGAVRLDADRLPDLSWRGELTLRIFDYVNDADARCEVDEEIFECFMEDYPALWDGERFLRDDLLPFALVRGASALFFLDLGAGEGAVCPVVFWDHDAPDDFTAVAPDVASLGLKPA